MTTPRPRRLTLLLVAVLTAPVLTGCAGTSAAAPPEPPGFDEYGAQDVRPIKETMPDGTVVHCLLYRGDRAGGLSCDWSRAQRPAGPPTSDQ